MASKPRLKLKDNFGLDDSAFLVALLAAGSDCICVGIKPTMLCVVVFSSSNHSALVPMPANCRHRKKRRHDQSGLSVPLCLLL